MDIGEENNKLVVAPRLCITGFKGVGSMEAPQGNGSILRSSKTSDFLNF